MNGHSGENNVTHVSMYNNVVKLNQQGIKSLPFALVICLSSIVLFTSLRKLCSKQGVLSQLLALAAATVLVTLSVVMNTSFLSGNFQSSRMVFNFSAIFALMAKIMQNKIVCSFG